MRQLAILENLTRVHRYSGNILVKDESVSDHVCCMNALALEYVPKMNKKFDININIEKVIYAISVHDLDEALYTDIPRLFKHRNKKILSAINETVDEIFVEELGRDLYDNIKAVTDHATPVGKLVKIFDLAQAGYKMCSEIELGNRYFLSQIENVTDTLNGFYEDFRQLSELAMDETYKQRSNTYSYNMIRAFKWIISEFLNEFDIFVKNNK